MTQLVGIIGSACRFPGEVSSLSKLWELLESPRDVLKEFPVDRLRLQNFYHPNGEHHGSTNVKNKAYLLSEDIRHFDAPFFRISPPEAAAMDPQHRILLEIVYEALESAGLPMDRVRGTLTSVWAGLMNGDYADIQARDIDTLPIHHATGTHRSILSNRVSYFFDVRGPSMTIDTACSSSLVALHQAVQSLKAGESDMAIVAGANLILDPTMYVAESKLHMLASDSRSRMWDADANGYARGEGFASIVLQRVEDAVRDSNHIECVIRGTAVNSDGRGQGSLTVPSAAAQTELIRCAYKNGGLDARLDRCHYFEAHGTGTQAGDPVEAQAIRDAFFGHIEGVPVCKTVGEESLLPAKLLVGSIKTVIGHLEGCAGLAGVLKASLAIQHRTVPPNMLFSRLNPAITPFYDRLEIVTGQSHPWPVRLETGSPRRVSVNSFGFGGTNAHVILESYEGVLEGKQSDMCGQDDHGECVTGPFLLSANSFESLSRSAEAHAHWISDSNKTPNLRDVAWTLQSRRTHFGAARASFCGGTRGQLVSKMRAFAKEPGRVPPPSAIDVRRAEGESLDILGIFTGQGAQWASMGRQLFLNSQLFRDSIQRCEASLEILDPADAPDWSLVEELLADSTQSRIGEAAISQPLCTAIQIALVDLLRASGVRFRAVVGHSSGEIAAAYAAGILPRAGDAIRIAYYRGLHITRDSGVEGVRRGAMLAVELSYDAATQLCASPSYARRVVIAAVNSPTSVTISGDCETIDDVKSQLDAEGTFARKLKVDRAYHSPHMEACAPAYRASLQACGVRVEKSTDSCTWLSSVRGDIDSVIAEDNDGCELETLRDKYWVDNLTSPVLFGPTVECALWRAGPFDVVLEVGPHPALQGPVTELLKASLGTTLPYLGVMRRGTNEVEAFSGALGLLWELFGPTAGINFDGYHEAFVASNPDVPRGISPRLVKGSPSYSWDHAKIHWREPKASRLFRLGDRTSQDMLGRRAPDDTTNLLRWRNILRLNDLNWVRGHKFQDQVVLPGVSYISAMIELARQIVDEPLIRIVNLEDVVLHRAVTLQEHRDTELLTSCHILHKAQELLVAEVTFSAASTDSDAATETTCSARMEIHVTSKDNNIPQPVAITPINPSLDHIPVDVESFYMRLKQLGLAFSGPFKAIKSAARKLDHAQATCSWNLDDDFEGTGRAYFLHPAVLDASLHSLLAAFASPATDRLWAPALPVAIRRVSILPQNCTFSETAPSSADQIQVATTAQITASSQQNFQGDIELKFDGSSCVAAQMEGVELQIMASQSSDKPMFSHVRWDVDISTGVDNVVLEKELTESRIKLNSELVEAMGRTALYYYRTLLESLSPIGLDEASWNHQMFIESARHWVSEVRSGRHPTVKTEWLEDKKENIFHLCERFQNYIDIELMRAIGENLIAIVRGQKQPLEVMMADDMLTRFYIGGHGLDFMNDHIARAVSQVTHRYPGAKILELGAGTAGTTRKVMKAVGGSFGHYTFTDISPGFFERAAHKFPDQVRRQEMSFRVLDIEQDIVQQGFAEGLYDVIVAANVIHATKDLRRSMNHVRRLLKPGGFLIMMEITGDLLRLGFILGILPGWWLGAQSGDEGRRWAPGITLSQWNDLLLRTGFSGLDETASDSPVIQNHYLSMLVTQAVDQRVNLLRSPLMFLSSMPALPEIGKLAIIGGETTTVARLASHLKRVLTPWASFQVIHISNLDQLVMNPQDPISAISLVELDQFDFFNTMSEEKLNFVKSLLQSSRSVLWLTSGCREHNPWASMFKGVARAVRAEQRSIALQVLDVGPTADHANSLFVAEAFFRLEIMSHSMFSDAEPQPLLWSTETELAYDNGSLLIPRLVPNQARNERYNANRRAIKKDTVSLQSDDWELELVCTSNGNLSLSGTEGRLSRQLARQSSESLFSEEVTIKVLLSIALAQPEHRWWLSFGSVVGPNSSTSKYAFALTDSNKSLIQVTPQRLLASDGLVLDEEPTHATACRMLQALAGQLIVRSLLPRLPRHGSVVFIDPSMAHVQAVAASRLWQGRKTCFATFSEDVATSRGLVWINPYSLQSANQASLPTDVSTIIDLATSTAVHPGSQSHHSRFAPGCVSIRFEPAFLETDVEALGNAYFDALGQINNAESDSALAVHTIPVNQIVDHPSSPTTASYPSVVDWRVLQSAQGSMGDDAPKTSFTVQPLSPNGLFSACKTHFMVGLNGDLGLSICNYMAANGARHIAISSRSGKSSPGWLLKMKQKGIHVRLYKMDVASKTHILSTLEQMRIDGMPPVAGVANGALVLNDSLFLNMDTDIFNSTLRPKVHGSRALDEVFDAGFPLDYFVLFSSLATIAGNGGQSNYHAANMFMTGLVANRRMRGLAASVMHVGVVADAGYVTRQGPQLLEHLRKQFFMPTSESDVRHQFAEAVLASPVDSDLVSDICMGLNPFLDVPGASSMAKPSWATDPILSHFLLSRSEVDGEATDLQPNNETYHGRPLRQSLAEATSQQEAEAILQQAFSAKLESMMQLDSGSVNTNAILLDHGFDSLLAVETRSWFLSELSVDVPVLRFLGSDTIQEICADSTARYLASCVPRDASREDVAHAMLEPPARSLDSSESAEASTPTDTQRTSTLTEVTSVPDPDVGDLEPTTRTVGASLENFQDKDSDQNLVASSQEDTQHAFERIFLLSYPQRRLWELGQQTGDPTANNITVSYKTSGSLDVGRLRNALLRVISHHPALQMCFWADGDTGEIKQGLLPEPTADAARAMPLLKHVVVPEADSVTIRTAFQTLEKNVWDLRRGETFGATLVSLGDERAHVVIFGYNLIVMDGVSWHCFLTDLDRAYRMQPLSSRGSSTSHLEEIKRGQSPSKYRLQGNHAAADVLFWEELYAQTPQALSLFPFASVTCREAMPRYDTRRATRNLDSALTAKIKTTSRRLRITPSHFYLTTMQTLFATILPDLDELCVGLFDANRPDDGSLSDTIGYFVNVLPLRLALHDKQDISFDAMARRTSAHVLEARRHGHVPLQVIIDRVQASSPLFHVAFNYRIGAMADVALGDTCRLSVADISDVQNNRNDLTLGLFENAAGSCSVHITCKSYLYTDEAAVALVDTYVSIVKALVNDEEGRVASYSLPLLALLRDRE